MNKKYLDLFCYWIRERDLVRRQKEAGFPPPWSNDPVFQKFHFCNVRREDDRGTKEIREVVRKHKVDYWDLPWVYTMARLFNKAATLDIALQAVKVHAPWEDAVKALRDRGETVFHTAYVVSTCGKSMDKVDYVGQVVAAVRSRVISPGGSCQEAYENLMMVDGMGSFLAGQVVADLKNDRYLDRAPDWFSWSSPGPGSLNGLSILYDYAVTPRIYEGHMNTLCANLPPDILAMKIHRQDLQNCLCEFQKYIRYLEGRKGRRRPYNAR